MGCTKSSQKQEIEDDKQAEIVYNESLHHNPNILTKESNKIFFFESINLQNMTEASKNNNCRNEISLEQKKRLNELSEKIRKDRKRLKSLTKCQIHILEMQKRKHFRLEKLKNAEFIDFNLIIKNDSPLSKEEINNFFQENPPKQYSVNLKLEKKDPLKLDKGIIYYGEWDMIFYTRHGRGIQIWPDGSFYKGYWENDKAEGKGEFRHSSGDFYIGEWKKNKRDGYGYYKSQKGNEFKGNWKNDKRSGEGEEKWEDGSKYFGHYLLDKKDGKGEMRWSNGCTYKGYFKNGKLNGKGTYTFDDNRVYKGDFVNNTFEGKGTFIWPNKNKYNGHFKNNKRDGFGIFTFEDGRIFRGKWKKGKKYGEFDIYVPEKGIWIKKKVIENKNKNEDNIIIIPKEDKDQEDEDEENDKNNDKLLTDGELENIGEIKKIEQNKIEGIDEEDLEI